MPPIFYLFLYLLAILRGKGRTSTEGEWQNRQSVPHNELKKERLPGSASLFLYLEDQVILSLDMCPLA